MNNRLENTTDTNAHSELNSHVKKKRGRPRKYPIVDSTNKVKKKRGRPKGTKNKKVDIKSTVRTRGRPKKIDTFKKIYSMNNIINNIESNNIIVHLPIKSEDIKKTTQLFKYNPTMSIPNACNEDSLNFFSIISDTEIKDNTQDNTQDSTTIDTTETNHKKSTGTESQSELQSKENNSLDTNVYDSGDNNGYQMNQQTNIDKDNYYSDYNYNLIHKNNWYKEYKNIKTANYIKDLIKFKEIRDKNRQMYCKTQHKCSENILKDFNTATWPTETPIYCWWCCHPFNSIPCSIPEKIIDDTFIVYGIFCSPECGAAYLFNDCNHSDSQDIWTKYSLLNLLYKDMYNDKQIEQAYSRQVLKIFGGPLSITEFRNTTNKSLYQVNMPKLKSIIPTIGQSNIHPSYSSNNYKINSDSTHTTEQLSDKTIQQINQNKDTLVLKRSKPFRKYNNTLEKCMNLTLNAK